MHELDALDQFWVERDGDHHEREFWHCVAKQFPAYEILWRQLVVPLTNRIDPKIGKNTKEWIRMRPTVPTTYEKVAMAHYSVFYFISRAAKRFYEEKSVLWYPEDVLGPLDSAGDNFKLFLQTMNSLAADSGSDLFGRSPDQFPKAYHPFDEISDYRDVFLHNTVIGRAVDIESTYVPVWNPDPNLSPLNRVKKSWRAEKLSSEELISTEELLRRLIDQACYTLESHWRTAIQFVLSERFQEKMVSVTGLAAYFPVRSSPAEPVAARSDCIVLGSNTRFRVPSSSGDYSPPER